MRLLLTSAGFANESLANALLELTQKPFNSLNLAFIPTAANVEEGDKSWLIDDLGNCKKLGFASIDVVDFSALPRDIWRKRLEMAEVLLFGGGNTFHLIYWLKKSGLDKLLPKMLEEKVYVGISAGSIVASESLSLSQSERPYYPEGIGKYKGKKGLGFVNFLIRPHLNSPRFPKVRIKYLQKLAKEIQQPIYAIDDNSAVKVTGSKITVVSEGKWKRFN